MNADGVFEGGGVRGIALVGAAEAMEEAGYHWANLAGTSAGAIVASLLISGYRAAELVPIMTELDLRVFARRRGLASIPYLGAAWCLWNRLGLANTKALQQWLEEMLAAKGVRTFGELRMHAAHVEQPFHTWRLAVVVSDITRRRMAVLPHDLPDYGKDPDRFPVARAVCMSAAAPFVFQPLSLGKSQVVDGGLLSNFPVWLFDSEGLPGWPTFGFQLQAAQEESAGPKWLPALGRYGLNLGKTIMEGHDRYWEEETRTRSMVIPTGSIGSFNFQLTDRQKKYLYLSGRKTAREFLERFDFPSYKRKFRVQWTPGGGQADALA